ncbi:hypothetical protein HDF16_002123 [Granulicella aggregans]|uniref:Uncharacterized protein n=1 Tax=Granulicella aggregans TaxID=474949 RepID=A0A7W7ZCU2_9BACT|nr:hypothetical protein [Granulicella aggregans]MBB5057417.1 hypothetical protein [Granulicella aggregans]
MGGPQWGFGTSFATNFTVGTGLLSLALGGSLVTDSLHYLTKTHYLFLSLLFAALLLIAPALFTFFAKQQKFPSLSGPPTLASVGWVWLYILTSTLMVGAVVGQLLTVGLVMAEIGYRGYLGCGVLTFFEILIAIACIGAFICAIFVAPRYLEQQSDVQQKLVPQLKSLGERYKSMEQHVAGFAPIEADRILIDHLINREEVPPRWTMF